MEQEHTALTLQNTAGAIYQGNSQLEGTHSFHFPLSLPPTATAQIIEICLNFYILPITFFCFKPCEIGQEWQPSGKSLRLSRNQPIIALEVWP